MATVVVELAGESATGGKVSKYSETRKELADKLAGDSPRPCRTCQESTDWQTLSDHGGMCFRCFKAYCREFQNRPDVGRKEADPLSWARALQRRHQAGERLSKAQIDAYQDALKAKGRMQGVHSVMDDMR